MFDGNGRGHGTREQDFRAYTERNAATMNGVTTQLTYICKRCRTSQPIKGRRMAVAGAPRLGYVCAVCLAKRGAA